MTPSRWNDPYRQKADPRATATRHRGRLLAMDDVVSVGLGFDASHRTVIIVGVTSESAVETVEVPGDLDGVPVEVRVVGELTSQSRAPEDEGPSPGK